MTDAGTDCVRSRPAGRRPHREEQADDAAALLDELEVGPAAVFGTSSGGNFALCLLVRHPAQVRGAILHEPGLYALVDFDAVRAPLRALVQEAVERGGPPAAVEAFWCYVAGDDGWTRLPPMLRERLRATAPTLFGVELGTYELYMPDEETLAAIPAPVSLLISEDGFPFSSYITCGLREAVPSRSPRRRAAARGRSRPPRRACGDCPPIPAGGQHAKRFGLIPTFSSQISDGSSKVVATPRPKPTTRDRETKLAPSAEAHHKP